MLFAFDFSCSLIWFCAVTLNHFCPYFVAQLPSMITYVLVQGVQARRLSVGEVADVLGFRVCTFTPLFMMLMGVQSFS